MNFAEPEALLERLTKPSREVVFLLGAPLTAPTKGSPLGVPDVKGVLELIRNSFLQSRTRSLDELTRKLLGAPNPYQVAFEHLSHYRGTDAANALIREAVLRARLFESRPTANELSSADRCEYLENDLHGWHYTPAVAALGQIAAGFSPRLGRTLLTTNFDPLIELSIRRAGGRVFSRMLAGDGSLDDMRGEGSCVVHLHGYWLGTDTLHTPLSLGQDRPLLRASLQRLLRRYTVVVMGYSGWDDIFTRALVETCGDTNESPDVLWCCYESEPAAILRSNARLFEKLQPAIVRHRVTFIPGINCHDFLPRLWDELVREGGGARPSLPGNAPVRAGEELLPRKHLQDELLDVLEGERPAQLIGPRRLGKSTLLHWLERKAREQGKAVAFVNARGLEGRSPVDLVLAIGRALERAGEVKRVLETESAVPDTRAAERAIKQLVPLCLLVDEADALAEQGHGFDKDFFTTLRALGQERKLTWVSASEADLFDLYRSTGLTSAFLNDARRIRLGALSPAEAGYWLRERGVRDESRVALGIELAGGVAPALVWMAHRLADAASDLAALERDFRRWGEPLFKLWWQRLEPVARALLKRCGSTGLRLTELDDNERRLARLLVDEGFLLEEGERFRIWGQAWSDFVHDAS